MSSEALSVTRVPDAVYEALRESILSQRITFVRGADTNNLIDRRESVCIINVVEPFRTG